MTRRILLLLVLSATSLSTASFVCPENFPCYCMRFGDFDDKHKVHCTTSESNGSAFDLTVQAPRFVRIQCVNNPDWADFLLSASLRVGNVQSFYYVGCALPGPKFSESVVDQLGVNGVEFLKIEKLQGSISKRDLDVFSDLKTLVLTGNQLGNVAADLLYGLPKLAKLELRDTGIQIPAGFFKNSQSLTALELSHNDLHDLAPGVFDGLNKIELLNMWGSNISTLDPRVFRGLGSLLSLDIKMNGLRALPNDIFQDLTNLKVVNFGMNNFSELPASLFSRSRGLKVVKLTHQRVNLTELPGKLLGDLVDLKVVSLERMGLTSVPENLFWGSDGIVELNINRNYLTTLPANLLRDARELHKLSLSFNDLQVLPDRLFSHLGKLIALDLSRNHLSMVNEHLFDGLDSLQELNMEQNDLKFIEVDAFVPLVALRIAKFSHNQLQLRTDLYDLFGQVSPFHGCKNLEELYLSHNNITEIFSDWTVSHFRLQKLDLSYNLLEYLQTEDLQFVSDKLQVDLTHNSISTVDLSRLEFIAAEQTSPREVVINLNFNPIYCNCELYSLLRYTNGEMNAKALDFVTLQVQHLRCDGPEYMQGVRLPGLKAPELKCLVEDDQSTSSDPCASNGICNCWLRPVDKTLILDCAARNLTEAPPIIYPGNADFLEIDLSGNSLRVAPSLMDNGYEKVRLLNLARNHIEYINETLISPDLKILHLDGNNLSLIDDKLLEMMASNSNISLLTLSNNPWNCDCEGLALLDFVQNSYQLIHDRHELSCASSNLTLSSLQPTDFCPYPIHLIVSLSLIVAFVALFIGISAALFFYYNREIKIYLYSKNLCLWLITQEELDKDKIWDAFISYSHRDEEFVIKELVNKLENDPKPYRFCIHGRDWLAGDWIPNNIMRSVEESRRTVIVLSPHFIESEWGKLEFQAAHKKALSDKCARVIVILYGDIDPAKIEDPDLRGYLKMNTYVKWGDPLFYQKLRYALPHKYQLPKELNSNKIDNWHVADQEDVVQVKVC